MKKQLKTPHVLWTISIAVGSWCAGMIAGLTDYNVGGLGADHLGVIAGLLTGIVVTMATAVLIAIVFVIDDLLIERAHRPAPKHARRR